MSYLDRLRAVSAGSEPSKPSEPGFEPFEGSVAAHAYGFSNDIADGVKLLASRRAPRIRRPEAWPQVVSDSLRIARDGWARTALALGWDPLELWGCTPDGQFEGLAAWLSGRRLALIDDSSAIAAKGGQRFIFTRGPTPAGTIFLWNL